MVTIIYTVGSLAAVVVIASIIAMIIETVRTATTEDHMGNWWDD